MRTLPKKMTVFDTTIAALSTPPGKGGVALIRVSGKDAIAIVSPCFSAFSGKKMAELTPRTAVYGNFLAGGTPIDDVMITVFLAPASYTGEDTVEITCHGSMLICRTILEELFAHGARPAERGEFTRRAFMAGKLGLSEAEAIGELLDAKNPEQLRLLDRASRSRISSILTELYEELVSLLASVYAKIDYPDEDLAELSDAELRDAAQHLRERICRFAETYQTGRAITEGISTALIGKPNTGKSSVYNLLCGREAAIVTEIAGTTRDVLETTVTAGRVTLRLSDTAGIRQTADPVESIGVARSREAANAAELVLALFDGSRPADEEDASLIDLLDTLTGYRIALINKSDKEPHFDASLLAGHADAILAFSATQGDPSPLFDLIEKRFTDGSIRAGEDAILTSARQHAALRRAAENLATAIAALDAGVAVDAAIGDLELALCALGEVDGRQVSEDVVAHIFSKFCVGK